MLQWPNDAQTPLVRSVVDLFTINRRQIQPVEFVHNQTDRMAKREVTCVSEVE